MTLGQYAATTPTGRVRLEFRNDQGQTGTLITTAANAANPNRSGRYFPPGPGYAAAALGWPVPYWYANELVGWAPIGWAT